MRGLGLVLKKDASRMKAMNSEARPIAGFTKGVPITIGPWSGVTNLMAVPSDDVKVILGMDFLSKAKAVPMPYLNTVCLFGDAPCMIPATHQVRGDVAFIEALQLKRGLRKGEPTYLAALKCEGEMRELEAIPEEVQKRKVEFEEVMPDELDKAQPPRRAVDHQIELEPGARPPARAPYRMSPPELAELRKQLTDLLEAGFIRPSLAPYGALVPEKA